MLRDKVVCLLNKLGQHPLGVYGGDRVRLANAAKHVGRCDFEPPRYRLERLEAEEVHAIDPKERVEDALVHPGGRARRKNRVAAFPEHREPPEVVDLRVPRDHRARQTVWIRG